MSHETAYTDTPCSAAIPITPHERRALAWDPHIVRKISEFILSVITYYDKTGVYHLDGEKLDTLDTRPVFHEEEVRALEGIVKKGIGLREET